MQFSQGFLLSRLEEFPDVKLPDSLSLRQLGPSKLLSNNKKFELEKLIVNVKPVAIDEVCSKVYQIFKTSVKIQSIAVIDENEKPIGVIYSR